MFHTKHCGGLAARDSLFTSMTPEFCIEIVVSINSTKIFNCPTYFLTAFKKLTDVKSLLGKNCLVITIVPKREEKAQNGIILHFNSMSIECNLLNSEGERKNSFFSV